MLPYTTYSIPETERNETENNSKWLWMVVQKPLSELDIDLLQKISTAVKADYTNDTFCLLQPGEGSISIASMQGANPKLIISFGVLPSALGLWIDLNRAGICIMESSTFILTLPLDELAKNSGAKKELWQSMQIFLER